MVIKELNKNNYCACQMLKRKTKSLSYVCVHSVDDRDCKGREGERERERERVQLALNGGFLIRQLKSLKSSLY